MSVSPEQHAVLSAVARFEGLGRYQGLMPGKHVSAFDEQTPEELIRLGLIEEVEITYDCGKVLKGLRLTPQGRLALERENRKEKPLAEPADLALEHLLLLQDVLHFSRMPRYRFMLPAKKARTYAQDDLDDLLARGYLLKLKVSTTAKGTVKGYVISSKGKKALAQAKFL